MTAGRSVLVLTHRFDPTADYVVEKLNRRGVPVFRCDTSEFPRTLSVSAELTGCAVAPSPRFGPASSPFRAGEFPARPRGYSERRGSR